MAAVHAVLEEVDAGEVPCIDVYNKADRLDADERQRLEQAADAGIVISALHGQGQQELLERLTERLGLDTSRVTLRLDPDSDAGRRGMAWVYRHGRVVRHTNRRGRACIEADVSRRLFAAFRKSMAGVSRHALSMGPA
jgi:GTP-binding protein HflX